MPSAGLPRAERLRKRIDFINVQSHGKKLHTESFLVFVRPRPDDVTAPTRLGITASRKVGGAVARNRVKRLVREAFRRHKTWFPVGLDVVFVAKRGAPDLAAERVVEELEKLCRRHFAE